MTSGRINQVSIVYLVFPFFSNSLEELKKKRKTKSQRKKKILSSDWFVIFREETKHRTKIEKSFFFKEELFQI